MSAFIITVVASGLVLIGTDTLVAQTANTSTAADQATDVVTETVDRETPSSDDSVSLDFLNEGKNPKSLAQLKAMEDHVREVSDRVKEATVNINMGMGQGTGVIVSSDGIILTAAHVIERPRKLALITFSDGSQARATTLGVEAGKDSGMLKIYELIEPKDEDDSSEVEDGDKTSSDEADSGKTDEDNGGAEVAPEDDDTTSGDDGSDDDDSEEDPDALPLKNDNDSEEEDVDVIEAAFEESDLPFFPYLDMAISEDLKDGQWVIAVGHPGGLDEKRGMVVRVGRIINQRDTAIRTDCTLVGGDSGGPLVDMDGNLIAIHSRIGSRLQDNLHVPIDVFSDTWDRLISGYKIGESGKLGVTINPRSTLVSDLAKNGPAARGGLHVGDIITAIGDTAVTTRSEIGKALADHYPYEKVTVTVRRGSNDVDLVVMLGEDRPARSTRRRR